MLSARSRREPLKKKRAISMEDIRLSEPRTAGEDVMLVVEVLATTYRRPSDAEAAATAGAPQGS